MRAPATFSAAPRCIISTPSAGSSRSATGFCRRRGGVESRRGSPACSRSIRSHSVCSGSRRTSTSATTCRSESSSALASRARASCARCRDPTARASTRRCTRSCPGSDCHPQAHLRPQRSHDAAVTRSHPTLRGGTATRFVSLTAALLLYGWGELLTVRADVGLGPWDVLHQAISDITGLSFGVAVVAVSFTVLVLAWVLGERPGLGTLMNALIVGASFDLFDRLNLAPHLHGGPTGVALDVAGIMV